MLNSSSFSPPAITIFHSQEKLGQVHTPEFRIGKYLTDSFCSIYLSFFHFYSSKVTRMQWKTLLYPTTEDRQETEATAKWRAKGDGMNSTTQKRGELIWTWPLLQGMLLSFLMSQALELVLCYHITNDSSCSLMEKCRDVVENTKLLFFLWFCIIHSIWIYVMHQHAIRVFCIGILKELFAMLGWDCFSKHEHALLLGST